MGRDAPGTFAEFIKLSPIKQRSNFKNANDMIECLLSGHDTMIAACKQAIEVAASAGDEATEDLLTERIAAHGKISWMLRVTLEK